MEFDEDAELDTSRVDDLRGQGSGGFGISLPGGGLTLGGGIVGLVLALVVGVLGLAGVLGDGEGNSAGRALAEKCARGNPDRFRDADCRQTATFNDLRAYWGENLFPTLGARYRDPTLVLFSGGVNTGCGAATSAVGPFYCPADQRIYLDLEFYQELATRFGAPGEFAQAYVLAHEFGHHLQFLTGTEAQVRRIQRRGPPNAGLYSIALELQADCYAGVWANGAAAPDGLVGRISDTEVAEALRAAAAVGDDRLQERSSGRVNPETWTHGSAAQRQQWFRTGFSTGDPRRCNTFSARAIAAS